MERKSGSQIQEVKSLSNNKLALIIEQDSEIWFNIYNILEEIKYKNEILDDMSIVDILLSVY
jgi:UDP-N-acetylglucosamine:LPS N-acetylglucosamine transferase